MARHYGGNQAAVVIRVVADIMALILGLWILMYVLDANRANDLVSFVRDAANWLAGWSHDLFTMDTDWLRVLLNYGLPAVVYLLIGHALAARVSRL
ncbi:hypothetical protein [Wenjunlia tyrosinilytica]|uniref:hypothetical protein n=1 Tax=Wenjunlia tyrosinilytica TaxID=1544741 RepID=UPI0016654AFC|nr:hypothetical protein [Wenjunlia tyrosinilytica]